MIADNDLICRRDAVTVIQSEMKHIYTPPRRQGYKAALDIIMKLPRAKAQAANLEPPVLLSPTPLHSFWWVQASGWWMCDNCGGRSFNGIRHLYCPHCGARMDAEGEIE